MADPRDTFYVLAGADDDGRPAYACRLVEKAYLHDHRVVVRLDTPEEAARFDELLWRFSDRSFVPHERAGAGCDAPVIVLAERSPNGQQHPSSRGRVTRGVFDGPPAARGRLAS